MPVTIHPPITSPDTPIVEEARGIAWSVGSVGTLDIIDTQASVVSTFSAQSWGWVEKS